MANEYCLPYERPPEHHLRDALNNSGAAIAAKRFVKGNENGILYPAANTDVVYGLVRMGADDGKMCNVQLAGTGVATAGSGGVTANVRLTVEAATGKVVPWAPAAGVNATIVGISTNAASADGDVFVELVGGPGVIAQGA
jgi:hypothetical protein